MWTQGWQGLYDNARQGFQDELANALNIAKVAADAKRYVAESEYRRWQAYTQAQQYEAELRNLVRPKIEQGAKEQLYGRQMDQILAKAQGQLALKDLQMKMQQTMQDQRLESAKELAKIKQEPKDPVTGLLLQGTEKDPERRLKTLLQYQRLQALLKSDVPNEAKSKELERQLLMLLAGQDPNKPLNSPAPVRPLTGAAWEPGPQIWDEPYWARGGL